MNKINTLLSIGVAALAVFSGPAQAELKSITIGTNPTGSTYFLLGGGFAKLFQEKLGIRSNAVPQSGSSVYLPMVASGTMTLGISSTIDAGMAYRGDAGFPVEVKELRTIGSVWVIPYGFVTKADSGIKTIEDLKGKRVMGDIPTNVSLTAINKAILKSGGLSPEDVSFARSGGLLDGLEAVVQGRADAAPVATAIPAIVRSNASVPGGLRLIGNGSLGSDAFFASELKGLRAGVAKPIERRPFILGETDIVKYEAMLVTNVDQNEDDIFALTKVMHENWAQLQKDYGPMRGVSAQEFAIVSPSIPYHPGAIRYFKEVGLWSEAHAQNEAQF